MSKTVPFQTIQFSISTQFKSKYTVYLSKTFLFEAIQFSQAVLIQTIQFSISMQIVLFNPKIGPLSGATIPDQSGPGSDAMKGYSAFPKVATLLELHYQIIIIIRTLVGGGVLLFCREAVGVFYSPSRLCNALRGFRRNGYMYVSVVEVEV